MKLSLLKSLALPAMFAISTTSFAQQTLATSEANALLLSLGQEFTQNYVFADTGKKVADHFALSDIKNRFTQITDPAMFAQQLTSELLTLTNDKHIRVMFHPKPASAPNAVTKTTEPPLSPQAMGEYMNFGVERVERLPANLGYLSVNFFPEENLVEATYAAAMTFLAHTDGLIIDMRRNGGGQPESVALLASYFFDKRTHLNDIYWRDDNEYQSFYTKTSIDGKPYGERKPVYILTSANTGSGGEGFTYELQQLKRATVIGETTVGAANPGGPVSLNERFSVFIPTGRAINPISKTNWEGVGVKPDVNSRADDALREAQIHALNQLKSQTMPSSKKAAIERRLAELQK